MMTNSCLIQAWKPNTFSSNASGLLRKLVVFPLLVFPLVVVSLLVVVPIKTGLAATGDANQPVNVKADQSEFDERAGIQTLSGNVEITQGTLMVKADEIQIELKNGALFRIIGTGNPIEFQQETDDGAIMSGESSRIEYNTETTQITFSGNARFERPGQQLTGSSITYNISKLTFKASGDKKGRVNIVLQPSQIKR